MVELIRVYIDMGMDEESASRQALLDFYGRLLGKDVESHE